MTLETYAERTKPWKRAESVIDYSYESLPPKGTWLFVWPAMVMDEANELLQRRVDDARLESEIHRIRASTRAFWVKQGGAR